MASPGRNVYDEKIKMFFFFFTLNACKLIVGDFQNIFRNL